MGSATRESGSGPWDEDIVLFYCPGCEGHAFTSKGVDVAPKDGAKWTGVCEGCGFEWPRAEDWRHFKRMLIRAFTSAEDLAIEGCWRPCAPPPARSRPRPSRGLDA